MKLIEFDGVDIPVQKKEVLKNVDFILNSNEFVFLTGKIGTGKTTFLKSIYAENKLETGLTSVLDFDLKTIKKSEIPYLRRQIGYIFQDFNFLNDRSVYDNFKFVLEATGWNNLSDINLRIEEVLNDVEMLHKKDVMPFEVSGGELQRISVARAILNKPKIILADEPTGNLDEESSVYITKKLFEQVNDYCSVICVTHNLNLFKLIPNSIIYKIDDNTISKQNSKNS